MFTTLQTAFHNFMTDLSKAKGPLMVFGALFLMFLYFASRYTIGTNGAKSDCLNTHIFLIDTWDTQVEEGQLAAFVMTKDTAIYKKGTKWLKRVAAMPGQTVQVDMNFVRVGDKKYPLDPAYVLNKLNMPYEGLTKTWVMGPDEIFMIGETLTSFDSRFWGPIHVEDVYGRAYAIF